MSCKLNSSFRRLLNKRNWKMSCIGVYTHTHTHTVSYTSPKLANPKLVTALIFLKIEFMGRKSYEKTGKNLKCILLSKRSPFEKVTYIVWHSGKGKRNEKVSGSQGLGKKEGEIGGTKDFRGMKLFCMIFHWWTCHHTVVRTTECATPRLNPHVNCWLGVTLLQYKLIIWRKSTTLVQNVNSDRGYVQDGNTDITELSTFRSVFLWT